MKMGTIPSSLRIGARPCPNVIKLFTVVIYEFSQQDEVFELVMTLQLIKCLLVRPEAYLRVEHLKVSPLG